jgi:hypothetical protein
VLLSDVPAEQPDPSDPDYNATYVEATKGKKLPPAGEQMEAIEDKGLSMVIIGGLSGLLILLVIIIVIIVVVRRRNRNHIPDHKFYNGGPAHSMSNGDTVCVQGKEVDNIQLQIHRSPLPTDTLPHKSPVESRKHQVKMNSAMQSPLLDPRKVAWDQMLIRQALEDNEDNDQGLGEEQGMLADPHQQHPHPSHPPHPQPPLPPPPQEDLPPPPAFLLQNDEEPGPLLNRDDNGSYHAVLDGYHSEDNVDDIDVDEPFQVQSMPPPMYGQLS